jgi:hypothetical protein
MLMIYEFDVRSGSRVSLSNDPSAADFLVGYFRMMVLC